ncbi:hypothetical protein WJX82_009817 [Trebouxia sp. C0006]
MTLNAPPKVTVTRDNAIEVLKDFTAFDMDAYVVGKDKKWQFWNCEPSSFPFAYDKVEHLYMLAGKFSIQYEGAEPVTIVAGDFVKLPVGKVEYVVMEPTRVFFHLESQAA